VEITEDLWLTRAEVADRYKLPLKTIAEWASKGTGPRYARIGKHVRYRLSDVIDWENHQFHEGGAPNANGTDERAAVQVGNLTDRPNNTDPRR
jgi:predicted DNA-binding transcriptional regulator AlpA